MEAFFKSILADITDLPAAVLSGCQTDHTVLTGILGTEEEFFQIAFREPFFQIFVENALSRNAVADDIDQNQIFRICFSKILSQSCILAGCSV